MQHEILHGPSAALLRIDLGPGEACTAESGAMVSRSSHVEMTTRMNADPSAGFLAKVWAFLVAFVRKLMGGEGFFVNEFRAEGGAGEVTLAPSMSGEVRHRRLAGDRLILEPGAYLASTGDVRLKVRWGGLRSILAKEGAFLLEAYGNGDLFFNAYGGIEEVEVRGSYVVDTGHMVAFEPSLDFQIRQAGGGLKGLFLSGEGLVCEFQGTGKVWIQSRNVSSLVGWLTGYMP